MAYKKGETYLIVENKVLRTIALIGILTQGYVTRMMRYAACRQCNSN